MFIESVQQKIRNYVDQFTEPKIRAAAEAIAKKHATNDPSWSAFKEEADLTLRNLSGLKPLAPAPVTKDAWALMTPKEQRDHVMAGGKIVESPAAKAAEVYKDAEAQKMDAHCRSFSRPDFKARATVLAAKSKQAGHTFEQFRDICNEALFALAQVGTKNTDMRQAAFRTLTHEEQATFRRNGGRIVD